MTPAYIALALTLAFQPPAKDDRPTFGELTPIYTPAQIRNRIVDPKVKADLKLTKEQETGAQAIIRKYYEMYPITRHFDMKGTAKEKAAKSRVLDVAEAEILFRDLVLTLTPAQVKRFRQIIAQSHGNMLFEIPEARALLKMSDQQAADLKVLYKKLKDDIGKEMGAGKFDIAEAQRRLDLLHFSVPDRVRMTLSSEQQKILNDLLGERFPW